MSLVHEPRRPPSPDGLEQQHRSSTPRCAQALVHRHHLRSLERGGRHADAQVAAWALWATELQLTGHDLGEPVGWLNFDFSEAVPVE